MNKLIIIKALLVFAAACRPELNEVTSQGSSSKQTLELTLLHTNDHHGHFWVNERGEWGMPARSTLIRQIRQEVDSAGGHALLLSGGDVNTGTPASDMAAARPDFLGMKFMGYDAMAVGNHEFDVPWDVLQEQQQWAGFPFLSANIFYKGTDRRPFSPYIIKQVGSLKVAILGLTTDETPSISLKFPSDQLEIKSPIDIAMELVPELRQQSDVVIALTHMGHYADGEHGSQPPGDVTLARRVSGIDVIIGGHSQNPLFEPDIQNGTLILQAHEWGRYLGRLDLKVAAGEVVRESYELIPINHADPATGQRRSEIAQDQELTQLLSRFQEDAEEVMAEPVGESQGEFDGTRGVIRQGEAPLGNMITRVIRERTDADVVAIASGTIRASLPAGPLNFGHVLFVQPFKLNFVTATLSGDELRSYLWTLAQKAPGDGAFPQFAGLKLRVRAGEIAEVQVRRDGRWQELNGNENYVLATTDFHARGGGGYPELVDHTSYRDTGIGDADALREFIRAHSPIHPSQFPITGYYQRD